MSDVEESGGSVAGILKSDHSKYGLDDGCGQDRGRGAFYNALAREVVRA